MRKKLEGVRLEKTSGIRLPSKQHLTRTTFRITQEGHDAIGIMSKNYGMKNADVLDMASSLLHEVKGIDNASFSNMKGKLTRKTYLINKLALSKLEKMAKELKSSRDSLVDNMVITLKAVLDRELSRKHSNYQTVLDKIINPFWGQAEDIERQLKKALGEDDPITNRFGFIIVLIMNLSMAIEENINSGVPIDPSDFSQSS